MPRVYYAHPITWYNTKDEQLDVDALVEHGSVINPNSAIFNQAVEIARMRDQPVMQIFADYIKDSIDVVCFRRFKDGKIGSGVAREILEAVVHGKGVWELIDQDDGPYVAQYVSFELDLTGTLTVQETKRRILEGVL